MKRIVFIVVGVVALGLIASIVGCASSGTFVGRENYSAMRLEKDALAEQLGQAQTGAAFARRTTDARPVGRLEMPPGSVPARTEELWVIQRGDVQAAPPAEQEPMPGTGALMAKLPSSTEAVAVPLKHTEVKADILGYIATVDVTQQYHNPYDAKIEAVYVFPLPHNAAVNEFVMTVGERKIRGIIREKEEAKRIYAEAKSQGYVASLLTQERPNIFTQAVANIEPGKQIDINVRYFHTLEYRDGAYEFVFPMVVGPRFNPPGSADPIEAVARGTQNAQGKKVEYLRPNERSGHDVGLTVNVNAGVAIENLQCRSHNVEVRKGEDGSAVVALAKDDTIPNRDFVLRYQVAGGRTKSAIVAHRDERGGYFTLMIFPPKDLTSLPRKPLEMVFTMDVSGSMNGRPIEQAKSAMRYALSNMDERDTFQVITFASRATQLFERPVPVTRGNVQSALSFVNNQRGGGGTMMIEGIKASLSFPQDEERLRFVSFLTDGYIGNEAEILRAVHDNLGPSRIFSFGVGSSVNRYLLDHMAKMGSGAVAYLSLNDKAEDVMGPYFERISHPAMTDVEIDWGGMKVSEVYPRRAPDLFVGRPVILSGRFEGTGETTIKVKGRVGNEVAEMVVPVNVGEATAAHKAIPAVWARTKIADLADRSVWDVEAQELPAQVRQVALEYGLMSPYTAFVAVDSLTRTAGTHGVTVHVPVPVPEGVRYETTVREGGQSSVVSGQEEGEERVQGSGFRVQD
jgi:Ca-activated chloride channel family protein